MHAKMETITKRIITEERLIEILEAAFKIRCKDLAELFVWSEQPEGHEYWGNIYVTMLRREEYREKCRNTHEEIS